MLLSDKVKTGKAFAWSNDVISFIRLNKKIGLKGYKKGKVAIATRKRQEELSKVGLAPKVGKKIYKIQFRDKNVYWYKTEIVRTIQRMTGELGLVNEIYDIESRFPKLKKDFYDLKSKLIRNRVDTQDTHTGNIGYLPNGNLVMIDFSIYGMIS